MAVVFCLIMSFVGCRRRKIYREGHCRDKAEFVLCTRKFDDEFAFGVMIYTNDMFTAYVFIEINTIAAGGLIFDP